VDAFPVSGVPPTLVHHDQLAACSPVKPPLTRSDAGSWPGHGGVATVELIMNAPLVPLAVAGPAFVAASLLRCRTRANRRRFWAVSAWILAPFALAAPLFGIADGGDVVAWLANLAAVLVALYSLAAGRVRRPRRTGTPRKRRPARRVPELAGASPWAGPDARRVGVEEARQVLAEDAWASLLTGSEEDPDDWQPQVIRHSRPWAIRDGTPSSPQPR
jgi:hypothetical protein